MPAKQIKRSRWLCGIFKKSTAKTVTQYYAKLACNGIIQHVCQHQRNKLKEYTIFLPKLSIVYLRKHKKVFQVY